MIIFYLKSKRGVHVHFYSRQASQRRNALAFENLVSLCVKASQCSILMLQRCSNFSSMFALFNFVLY